MIGEPLLAPVAGLGVCEQCFTPVPPGQTRCRACAAGGHYLAAFAPIAYSVAGESLHHEIACYKRDADPSVDVAMDHLALLLGRFLIQHESCVAAAAGVEQFDVICTVPSGYAARPGRHPLERIVGERLPACAARYRPLLTRSVDASRSRRFDPGRFLVSERLDGQNVLLIDDMWTTGATAQSAAAALRRAGAETVAAVVIARHIKRSWASNDAWLRECAAPLRSGHCVHCPPEAEQVGLALVA